MVIEPKNCEVESLPEEAIQQIRISDSAHVVLPHHGAIEKVTEESDQSHRDDPARIGPAYQDKLHAPVSGWRSDPSRLTRSSCWYFLRSVDSHWEAPSSVAPRLRSAPVCVTVSRDRSSIPVNSSPCTTIDRHSLRGLRGACWISISVLTPLLLLPVPLSSGGNRQRIHHARWIT